MDLSPEEKAFLYNSKSTFRALTALLSDQQTVEGCLGKAQASWFNLAVRRCMQLLHVGNCFYGFGKFLCPFSYQSQLCLTYFSLALVPSLPSFCNVINVVRVGSEVEWVRGELEKALDAFLEINNDLKKALTVPPASRRTPSQRLMFVNCENLEWTDHGLLITRRGTDHF